MKTTVFINTRYFPEHLTLLADNNEKRRRGAIIEAIKGLDKRQTFRFFPGDLVTLSSVARREHDLIYFGIVFAVVPTEELANSISNGEEVSEFTVVYESNVCVVWSKFSQL